MLNFWPVVLAIALLVLAGFAVRRALQRQVALQAQLRASEETYRSMVDALGEGVIIFDRHGKALAANAAAERLLGRTQAQMQAGALEDWQPLDMEGRPLSVEKMPLIQVLRSGVALREVTIGNVSPAGERVWLSVNAVPLLENGAKRVRGAVVSFIDITERRRVEAALAGSETTNRLLMNALADGVFVAQDLHFVFANRALPAMLGYTPDAFVGLPFHKVVAPDMLALWTERFLRRVGSGEEPGRSYEVRFLTHGGGELELELVATRASYLGRPAVLGVVRDITERKREHAELERHRNHLEDLVEARARELQIAMAAKIDTENFAQTISDNQPTLLAYVDRDRTLRFANRAYLAWYGKTREQIINQPVPQALFDSVSNFQGVVERVLQGETLELAHDITGAGGRLGHFLTFRMPRWRDGQVEGYYFIASNVTELRQAEHRLEELNEALTEARDRAEAAGRAKSAFLANMSHEIRTPMNAIIGLTHLLRRDSRDVQSQERLARVADAARHLLDLINDILDLSKIDSGKVTLEDTDFVLDELLGRACALVAEQANAKALELVLDTRDMPPSLRGDPTRLSQALVNLLSNAIKFTAHGSVTLRGSVIGSADPQTGKVPLRFEVQDTGIGIPADRIPHLFQAFEQADVSTTRRFGGTGLGLAITRHLAQLMGGEAGAESELGVGSRFWFTAQLQAADTPVDGPLDGSLVGLRALLVDDVAEAREALGAMLEQLGLRTEVAASGAEALALAQAGIAHHDRYDVVLIDWLMPEMDGLETARELLALTAAAPPACLLITAASDEALRERAHAVGMVDLLQKPISLSTLHDRLVDLLLQPVHAPRRATPAPNLSIEQTLRAEHAGARLLLAEDNLVNQEVALTLLDLIGFRVDVADTGLVAVQKARSVDYDLILMDMQMPELDGIEATQQIRVVPGHADTPIIAMTANAFDDDRAACLAAGMDDYVTKPVDPPVFYAVLSRWLQKAPAGAERAVASDAPGDPPLAVQARSEAQAAPTPDFAGITGLNTARGMVFFGGRPEVYRMGLAQFATLYEHGSAPLNDCLADATPTHVDRALRELHSMGGASSAIGATGLGTRAAQVAALLREAGPPDAREALAEVAHELHSLAGALRERLAQL